MIWWCKHCNRFHTSKTKKYETDGVYFLWFVQQPYTCQKPKPYEKPKIQKWLEEVRYKHHGY